MQVVSFMCSRYYICDTNRLYYIIKLFLYAGLPGFKTHHDLKGLNKVLIMCYSNKVNKTEIQLMLLFINDVLCHHHVVSILSHITVGGFRFLLKQMPG